MEEPAPCAGCRVENALLMAERSACRGGVGERQGAAYSVPEPRPFLPAEFLVPKQPGDSHAGMRGREDLPRVTQSSGCQAFGKGSKSCPKDPAGWGRGPVMDVGSV